MKKFVFIFGISFFVFSALFFTPMFLMGVVLMPVAIVAWIVMLLPVAYGSLVQNSYSVVKKK